MESNKFCPNCGTQLNGERFCHTCGRKNDSNKSYFINQTSSQTIFRIVALLASVIYVFLLFGKWFVLSLGSIGNLLMSAYDGYANAMSANAFNLFFKIFKAIEYISEYAGDSTEIFYIIIFLLISSAFVFILALTVIATAIRTFYEVCSKNDVRGALYALANSVIGLSSWSIILVWIVKLCIYMKMDEFGFGDYASYLTDIVEFTVLPVIVLITGILISVPVAFSIHLTKKENALNNSINYSNAQKLSEINEQNRKDNLLKNGGWTCVCGKVNPHYTGTCSCGHSKWDS